MSTIACAVVLLLGQDPSFQKNCEHLKSREFLIGTWVGGGEMAGIGKYTDEYTYSWAMNKNFIRFRYVMKAGGKEVYGDEGLIGWDEDAKCVVFFCFGMDGSIGHGKEVESSDKEVHVMEGVVSGDPMCKEWRSKVQRIDADHMQISCEIREQGAYKTMMKCKYARKK